MLKFLKRTVLWKQTFDADFRLCMEHLGHFDCQALQEKRHCWREKKGPAKGLVPGEAVFRAIEAFANAYYDENKDRDDAGAEFEELARVLHFAAPSEDRFGDYIEPRSFLSERWVIYLEAYLKHHPRANLTRTRGD